MKIAVVGTGGVGGYFGGKLAKAGNNVRFLARGAHLEAMRQNGLQIVSPEGDWIVPATMAAGSAEEVGPVDVILFCVKSYDTESAARQLAPMVSEKTIIISLQNGVDNEAKIQANMSRGIVFGGVSYIYATITSPGVITHTVGPVRIVFGELHHREAETTARAQAILDMMTRAGINATLAEDVQAEIWKKYVFIAAVGGMTALTRLTLGDILAVEESKEMLTDAMRETDVIGRRKGINLPDRFVEQILEILKKYDNNSRSSLYHDLVNNKRIEIDAFSGTIIRYGAELGIPTPVHKAIYAALLPYHRRHDTQAQGR